MNCLLFFYLDKLVPVPSVFFIDQNGSPAEIVVSETSEENVLKKITNAIDKCVPPNNSNQSFPEPCKFSCNFFLYVFINVKFIF